MLKVIFKVQKLVLKLKNIECEIVAKKDCNTIQLSPLLTISNGQACIDVQTQFLIIQNDPLFMIQVSLVYQGVNKLGGELSLNIAEWDENVHHFTVATLKKSPDRHSQICYTFLYIRKDCFASQKSLILCSEYRDQNLTLMEGRKKELTKKQNNLESQIKKLKQENQILQTNQKTRTEQMLSKQRDHDRMIRTYQQNIMLNNFQNDCLKKRNQKIVRMIQKYGKDQIKNELLKKYPQKNEAQKMERFETSRNNTDEIQDQNQNIRLTSGDSTKNNSVQSSDGGYGRGDRQRSRQRRYGRGNRQGDQ